MTDDDAVEKARARLDRLALLRSDTADVLSEADKDRIAEIVAAAPRPSEQQMNRLIAIFRPVVKAKPPATRRRSRSRRRTAGDE